MQDMKFLELLAEKYPSIQTASTEIINLNAILNLPKGTEHFISDIHGEDEAFCHILNNASGVIREKVDQLFGKTVDNQTRMELCTLIYYPDQKLKDVTHSGEDMREWYMITLYRLIDVCRLCASKYTRSKVRKALPKDFEYIIDELLHTSEESVNKQNYYENIITTIIDIDRAGAFIMALTVVIKRLAVDRLHVVGDIFDRGPHADIILDRLMQHHSVDIQWGNHDILWMGAACGIGACIAGVLNISTKYGNLDCVETAYGINLRPLALFAQETYAEQSGVVNNMHKAIAIIQFKLEGAIIKRHPEYQMNDRLVLEQIDFSDGTFMVEGRKHPLNDNHFPTVDPADPYKLTREEQDVVDQLIYSFTHSEKLRRHIHFLQSYGSIYRIFNGNLIFHGCIPMTEDGSFCEYDMDGIRVSGREYMDLADQMVRRAYYSSENDPAYETCRDFVWYLWCGSNSPLFGRDRMTTFERMFIDDETLWRERKNPYYTLVEQPEACEFVLREFGLANQYSHIINGHVPVRSKEGESPIKGGGKLIMIDGGFCRAYQKQTGLAGYTMFYNSHGIRLVSHQPFEGMQSAIENNADILSTFVVFDTAEKRLTVRDTDDGRDLQEDIDDLKELLAAYRSGRIKEKF